MEPPVNTAELPLYLKHPARRTGPKVVSFGGGHGLYAALRAFRLLTEDLVAVVTVADDGGSSGRLRQEFGGLPPGDLRMALAALTDDSEWGRIWRDVIQHRFDSSGCLDGHSVGNLLISALWQIHGDEVEGLDWVARLLRAHGRVLPMSSVPLTIEADFTDSQGTSGVIRGQSQVASCRATVSQVQLVPAAPPARKETIAEVEQADVLNLGPGSWYTSVMPHLLVPELAETICSSTAVKSLTLNLPGATAETRGLSLTEHLESLKEHAPGLSFDYILVDEAAAAEEAGLRDAAERLFAARLWARPLAARIRGQHDTLKLAACYRDMFVNAGLKTDEQW